MATKQGPLLRRLDNNRVFDITRNKNGDFIVREQCGMYYAETLTKDELEQLGNEIVALARGE